MSTDYSRGYQAACRHIQKITEDQAARIKSRPLPPDSPEAKDDKRELNYLRAIWRTTQNILTIHLRRSRKAYLRRTHAQNITRVTRRPRMATNPVASN